MILQHGGRAVKGRGDGPPAADGPDAGPITFVPYFGRVPRGHWLPTRPGPQPWNAGISPGWGHILAAAQPVTRAEAVRAARAGRAAIDRLTARIDELERQLRKAGG
jgi:hypothetical protein